MEPELFKEIRLKLGLTQWDVAEILGVTQSSVYLYETGKRKISEDYGITMLELEMNTDPVIKQKPGKKVQISFGMQSEVLVKKVKELQGNRTNREFLEDICV